MYTILIVAIPIQYGEDHIHIMISCGLNMAGQYFRNLVLKFLTSIKPEHLYHWWTINDLAIHNVYGCG